MSALAELRSATWSSHQRLEKRLDVKTRFCERNAYRAHLEKMWGFCAALEQRLDENAFDGALEDYESRRKLPLLTRDLIALGAAAGSVPLLQRCESLPACDGPAAAFGCLYVLEGATLGGRTLLPLVEVQLGVSALHGAAFLASYGTQVLPMWRRFGSALDAWCAAAPRRTCAARAAVATFDALDDWLCGSRS